MKLFRGVSPRFLFVVLVQRSLQVASVFEGMHVEKQRAFLC